MTKMEITAIRKELMGMEITESKIWIPGIAEKEKPRNDPEGGVRDINPKNSSEMKKHHIPGKFGMYGTPHKEVFLLFSF